MTLEDFFTLTEMKNGLTACARVEELIYVMQKENCVSNNVGDAARQWSTAASTLTSTQNRDCLDHFVHLNGLGFLNCWLQEAVKCSTDVIEGEELIITLLGSLDKLPVNPEKLYKSGIFATVEKLVFYKNVDIKERAHMLFEKWKNSVDGHQKMDKGSPYPFDSPIPSNDTASIEVQLAVEEVGNEGICKSESGIIQNLEIISADDLHLGDADEVKGFTCNHTLPMRFSNENERQMFPSTTTSVSHACQDNSVQGASYIPSSGLAFSAISSSSEIQVKDEQCNVSVMNNVKLDLKNGTGESLEFRETSSVPSSSNLTSTLCTKSPIVFHSVSCNLSPKRGKTNLLENKVFHRCASVDGLWIDYLKAAELKSCENGNSDFLDLPTKESSSREEAAESTSNIELCNEPTSKACNGVDGLIDETSAVHLSREIESNADSDLESGEIDALEIARQVAIQVEREVVDYREELCSSPEVSSNEIMRTESPSVEQDNYARLIPDEANGSLSVPSNDDCEVTFSSKVNNHMVAEVAFDPSKQDKNMETPNIAAVIPVSSSRVKVINFDFDLNEDASTEDIDCAVNPIIPNNLSNLSAPIAVFASKGAPGFFITPLCFEGGLGWRSSASTSAFRPACPRRVMDCDNTESGLTCKANLMVLDLNLSDCENYLHSMEEVPSSCMPSWNSASEDSSMRAERIKLDLNSNGLEEAIPSQSCIIKHHFLNGDPSSSPALSSPSPKRLCKNFDLNDNLFLSDATFSKNVGVKTDDPDITILGSTMSLERRVHTDQTYQSYIGSRLHFDATLATRPMLPYSHQMPHPSFGYIGMAAGMALPFQPAVYGFGNIKPMVDSGGATALPQMLSSAGANGAALSRPPFFMGLTSPSSGPYGSGPSHSGFDLNFSVVQMESGTGGERNPRQVVLPGPNSLTEEHFKATSQQDISGISKRKEPECCWEPYKFGYKHATSYL